MAVLNGARELRILGPIEVLTDQAAPAPALSPKHRTLLAALLVHANQVVSVDQLVDYLWGEQPPTYAVNLLRGYVSDLRRTLGFARSGTGPPPALITRAPGYVLSLAPGQLDLHTFQERAERGRSALAGGQPDVAAAALREALELWRGPALADVDSDSLRQREGGRLQELWLATVEDRIEADLLLGRHHALVAELSGLVGNHPMRERLRGQLMLALYRAGRQAEALAQYRDARQVLIDELGIEPGPALQQLERAVLNAEPSLDVPTVSGTAPERPAQLPADVTAFTGRDGHLALLDESLPDGSGAPTGPVVISAIDGTAGVGKTALATHWAHRVRGRFPDGQLCVNLRGHAQSAPVRPVEALAQFLRALGVPSRDVPDDLEEAASMYRSRLADRRMLILLDNARSAEQVRPLLPGVGFSLVLVTSRDQLTGLVARDGARRVNVGVLPPEEAGGLLARLLGADRVLAAPAATAELAQLCAYLPLALRIAAARLADRPDEPIEQYVARMRDGDWLTALTIDGDEHAGLRAAFDLSYEELPAGAQRLFRLLGLVPGPDVTADAAAALVGGAPDEARGILDQLARAHLIDQPSAGRYAFHDLLRRYAAELVAHERDRDAATGRLLDYYLRTADAAARELYPHMLRLPGPASAGSPSVDGAAASVWLDAEYSNLVAAVTHAAEYGPRPAAWRLSDALRGYFLMRMYTADWYTVAEAALAAARADGDHHGQAAAHLSLASLRWSQSRYPDAIEQYAHASACARDAGWLGAEAASLGNLGNVYRNMGRSAEAAECLSQALVLNRRTGDLGGQATNLTSLASLHAQLGRMAQAADFFAEALVLDRQAGSQFAVAMTLVNVAEASRALGRFPESLDYFNQSLALNRETANRVEEAGTLAALSALHCDLGQHREALEYAEAALVIVDEVDSGARVRAETLISLGTVHHHLGHGGRAVEYLQEALRLARDTDSRWPQAMALIALAAACQQVGRYDEARAHAHDALAVTRGSGYRMLEGQAVAALASIALDQQDGPTATRLAEDALAVHRETGHRPGEARTLAVLAAALGSVDEPAARTHRARAAALSAELGIPAADVRAPAP